MNNYATYSVSENCFIKEKKKIQNWPAYKKLTDFHHQITITQPSYIFIRIRTMSESELMVFRLNRTLTSRSKSPKSKSMSLRYPLRLLSIQFWQNNVIKKYYFWENIYSLKKKFNVAQHKRKKCILLWNKFSQVDKVYTL